MTAVQKISTRSIKKGRSRQVLWPIIRGALLEAKKRWQELADLLAEVRDDYTTYEEFLSDARKNTGLETSSIENHLRVGRFRKTNPTIRGEHASLDQALRAAGANRPSSGRVDRSWRIDVDALAERTRREQERLARLADEEMTRRQEREAQRELALRIIDIGYKVLAKELHPDKGGSRDMMARLNRARDHLKQMA